MDHLTIGPLRSAVRCRTPVIHAHSAVKMGSAPTVVSYGPREPSSHYASAHGPFFGSLGVSTSGSGAVATQSAP